MSEVPKIASATEFVRIDSIIVADRSRTVDPAWVDALAAAFQQGEMLNPITLWRGESGPQLVAGLHRLSAQKQNGEMHIEARWSAAATLAEAKVLETTENLLRRELTALDRAQHLFELKEAYEEAYPQAKRGGDKQTAEAREKLTEIISFSSDAAEKVGLSDRAIRMAVAMWKGLCPVVKSKVRGTWLADHQAGLMQLSKEKSKKVQQRAIALIFPPDGSQPKVTNVADALNKVNGGEFMTAHQKALSGIKRTLSSLSDEAFDEVMVSHEERILNWVKSHVGGVKA